MAPVPMLLDTYVLIAGIFCLGSCALRLYDLHYRQHKLFVIALHQLLSIGCIWSLYSTVVQTRGVAETVVVTLALIWIIWSYNDWLTAPPAGAETRPADLNHAEIGKG